MIEEQEAWSAVARRDHQFDGRFVFAVATTGIYCRPSCPARRPRPENVRFFAAPLEAETAGFRACLRCHPASPSATPAERIKAELDAWTDEAAPSLATLASKVALTPGHLQRVFTRAFGVSPQQYFQRIRATRLKERLKQGDDVSSAIYEAGYGSSGRAYQQAGNQLGMTPASYRRGGLGQRVRFAITEVSLGFLLVAVTERGICSVVVGDDADSLLRELREEFPQATLLDGLQSPLIADVIACVEGDAEKARALPLDLAATTFQLRVWKALREIPAGETRTYAQLAASIGSPRAIRAVASACASNRVAVVIPCHRVVRSDGAEGGYRWGAARKKALIARERR